jgi:hypothetical protein
MLRSAKETLRHPKFVEATNRLALSYPNAHKIIDGAVWEIERNPKGIGIYIPELDVYQARLVIPPVLLLYCINRRFVTLLTIIATDGSLEF